MRRRIRTIAVSTLFAIAAMSLGVSGASAQSTPEQGPGGPVLVVTDPGDPFGTYYAEILRAEGLNEFAVTSKTSLNATMLNGSQVVLLAQTTLDANQVTLLTNWVQAGGNLIAMRPDTNLAGLLGLGSDTGDLSNAYMHVTPGSPPGAGVTAESMQFHNTADRWSVTDASTVATLRADATTTASSGPAVTLRPVGSAGGQAAAFTYDLARSVVGTRQGNVAWAGQERDGAPAGSPDGVIRSDDLFFPDWLDFSKVGIPQADEQQRLLANLITQMNFDRMPLPRFWYLPRGEKAAVVMTGDDHDQGGTSGRFADQEAASPANCSVADWECVRSTSYVFPDTVIPNAQSYESKGFEIALHLSTGCSNFTEVSLANEWESQLAAFASRFPSLAAPRTNRTHCITWSDWAGEPKAELANGVRFDTNYYYWPAEWVLNRPGVFTGSGFPMRFADTDGSLIDVYQAATQLPDESALTIATHIDFLLDRAQDAHGYYGVFTANMHTDQRAHPGADAIMASAQEHHVPIVSAAQMLDWLDGRNSSSFQNLSFTASRLTFTVARDSRANGLEAMLPQSAATGQLVELRRNGVLVPLEGRSVKGINYAAFDAAPGAYVAAYGAGEATPPDTTIESATIAGSGAHFAFSANEAGARFECKLDTGPFAACANPADYSALADGSHTFSVRAIDVAGNVDPTPASRGFATGGVTAAGGGAAGGGQTAPSGTTTGAGGATALDKSAPRVTIVKRTVRASAKGLVTLRVACPRGEVRCRVDLRLRRGKRQLVRKMLTVAGGKTASVTLRLTRTDRLRLVRVRTLLVDAAATARDAAGNHATTTTRIRLLAPARKAKSNVR